jgi:hypothetical protein
MMNNDGAKIKKPPDIYKCIGRLLKKQNGFLYPDKC